MIYDISKEKTFLNVRNWLRSVREMVDKPLPLLLIGNKNDLRYEENSFQNSFIPSEQAAYLANEVDNCSFIEISCKTGFNVDEAIFRIIRMIIETKKQQNLDEIKEANHVSMKLIQKPKQKCC